MILTRQEIIREVKTGMIVIDPYDECMVNPNSYNYRLGDTLFRITDLVIDPAKPTSYEMVVIPPEGYLLMPGQLYLGSTLERVGSSKYAMQLIGRSSVGRLGLFLQVTAPLGHVGTSHCWTLELKTVQPLRVYPGMKIGQISFWCVEGKNSLPYVGKYWNYTEPHISEMFSEFKDSGK